MSAAGSPRWEALASCHLQTSVIKVTERKAEPFSRDGIAVCFWRCRLTGWRSRFSSAVWSDAAFYRYDPKTDTWTTVSSLGIPRDAVGVCLLGDRLYAVGGYDGQSYLSTVESYDAQTNEWTEVITAVHACFMQRLRHSYVFLWLQVLWCSYDPYKNITVKFYFINCNFWHLKWFILSCRCPARTTSL